MFSMDGAGPEAFLKEARRSVETKFLKSKAMGYSNIGKLSAITLFLLGCSFTCATRLKLVCVLEAPGYDTPDR
jgi:hypothetical protein